MTNTSVVYAQVDSELKEKAESILSTLGISPSNLLQMLYRQIVLDKSLPLGMSATGYARITEKLALEKLISDVEEGLKDIEEGRTLSAAEVDEHFNRKYGI